MAGSVIRNGWYSSGGTPDLAHIVAGTQRVYVADIDAVTGDNVIWYALVARVGSTGGTKRGRLAAWNTKTGPGSGGGSSRVPNVVLGRTAEFTTTSAFSGSNEGETRTLNLEVPFVGDRNDGYAYGATSRDNNLVVGMTQAANIPGAHNTWFYDRGATNGIPENGYADTVNAGHLAVSMLGEANVAPTAPTNMVPSGTIATRTPTIEADFNDANEVLNNGVEWDYAIETQIQVREGTTVVWDSTYVTTTAERTSGRTTRRYAGPALGFYKSNSFRVRHRDRAGEWGAWSAYQSFTVQHTNSRPNLPSAFTGAGDKVGSQSITVSAAFTDPDYPTLPDGQQWERFDAKQVIVRRVSDNAIVYNPGIVTTTTTERSNLRSSTTFTLPAWDVQYRWYERHRDRSGAWSDYASVLVKAVSGASVAKPSSPAGRITNRANPGTISAVYRNTGGVNAKMWQVGLFSEQGQLIDSSPVFEPVGGIAPNGVLTTSWAATGFGTLPDNTEFQIRVRALATSAEGWSSWSIGSIIITNAIPNTPTLYGPNADARSTLPGLSFYGTDPDQVSSSLTGTIELYQEDGTTLIATVAAPWNAVSTNPNVFTLSQAGLQAIVPGYGVYKWRARTHDGYEYSAWSPLWTLNYQPVPSVTITSPAGPTVTTMSPTITWDAPAQESWTVVLSRESGENVYAATGTGGTTKQHTILAQNVGGAGGGWLPGERWNNGETFLLTVMVAASGIVGSSTPVSLTLQYIPPSPLIGTGEAMSLPGVQGTHYAAIQHSQSDYTEGEFLSYDWSRVEIDGPAGNEIPGTLIENFASVSNSADTTLVDFDVTSNRWYRWGVRQTVQAGVDVISSEPVFIELMCSWYGTLLHMPFDPLNNYVWLQYGPEGDRYAPSRRRSSEDQGITPMHLRAAIDFSGKARRVEMSGDYAFLPRTDMSALDQMDVLDRMFDYQFSDTSPDGRPHIMCWREGRGGRRGRLYARLLSIEDSPGMGRSQAVSLEFAERHYVLGVQDESAGAA